MWRDAATAVDRENDRQRSYLSGGAASRCAYCSVALWTPGGFCAHHDLGDREWAESNRRWCDFFHRGRPLPRLSFDGRRGDFWEATA
jgi:hypothetical protein